jgi:hypothetical protein
LSFILAFRRQWFAAMSGGVSVPFAIVAVLLENAWAQSISAALAVTAVLFSSYRIWKVEREKVLVLEEHARPKLKCSYSMSDPGCYRGNVTLHDGMRCDWHRLKVEANSDVVVTGCKGMLVQVRRGNGILLSGEKMTLPFAHSDAPDATSKTIYPGAAEYIDFLSVRYDNKISFTPIGSFSSSIDWNDMFSLAGDYEIQIVVVASNAPSSIVDLLFSWNLSHAKANIKLMPA